MGIKLNRSGVTRLVIELNRVVIKIPNFSYSWYNFLQGLTANIKENQTWKWHPRKDLLCPILWASWGGWIVVMKKAIEVCSTEDIDYSIWKENGLGGDDKPDNYGTINNRIVKIDYGS